MTAAFDTYQLADALVQALRRDMRDDAAKYFWNETALPLYKKGIDMAYQLYELDQNPTYKLAILQCSERTKAPVLRESLADNAAKSFAGVPAYERQQERALRTRIAILEQRLNNLDKDPSVTTLLSQTRRQLYVFQDSLKTKYPTYARYLESISKDNPLSINDLKSIQKQLSDSTLLLEYAFGNQDIYTIALSNTDFKIFKKPLTPDFHAQIDRFINAVSDVEALKTDFNAAGKAYSETSFDLYQRLLEAPLVHFNAKNSIKRIHCVLEGKLHLLPFKALTDRKIEGFKGDYPQHFLVQKFAFSSLFSIQMLTQKDPSVSPLDAATFKLACFGLDFKDAALWRQKDAKSPIRKKNDVLTYAEPEIKGIASAFNGRFYFNQEATKPVFIADAPQYDFLHITTHGYPEGLVFQKKTATDSLNEVSIGDIYGLSLHTKFTFLSACETGKGTITEAEGVMSLGRAFTSAGSQSVSMTLWSIPDGATAEIAQRFYTNCHQGMPKDVAEQQAEKDYLNHPSSDAQLHPNNWAALTIIGDMSPIAVEKKGVKAWFWGFFIGLLILVLLILFSRNFFKT